MYGVYLIYLLFLWMLKHCLAWVQSLMISASDLSPHRDDDNGDDDGPTDPTAPTMVLILPSFTFVDAVTSADIPELITRFVDSPTEASKTTTTRLPASRPCPNDYVILLCSHRRRDVRCGISAPLLKREFERHLRPLGLYRDQNDERPGGVGIHFVSHVKGHKYAANVLIYRKAEGQMIWLARIRPEHCEGIVKQTIMKGKIVHPEVQLRGGFDRSRDVTSW
jgi:hypothetical protein